MSATAKYSLRYLLPLLALGAVVFSFYGLLHKYYLKLPEGCDEFGYMSMSRAITRGKLLDDHTRRPFDQALIPHLLNSQHTYRDYALLIAPHAHHLDPNTHKVINQYPPGVALLLSLIPLQYRQVAYAPLCVSLLAALLLWALTREARYSFAQAACLVLITASVLFIFPKWRDINSVAPTYGLLLVAGFLLKDRPTLSIFLLGTTTVFRFVNGLFFPFFTYLYLTHHAAPSPGKLFGVFRRVGWASLLFLLGGLGSYLVYVWLLLGNPLLSTYSYIDQAFSPLNTLLDHALYYFHWRQPWVWIHGLVLASLALITFKWHLPRRWLVFALLITLANYGFFIFHNIKITHYPYASAIIAMGILMRLAGPLWSTEKGQRVLHGLGAALTIALLAFARLPELDVAENFTRQVDDYQSCFSGHDVVWAEERSGTIQYTTDRAGFRYHWGSVAARRDVIAFLHKGGYAQAFWVADLKVPVAAITGELIRLKVPHRVKDHPRLGKVVETVIQ